MSAPTPARSALVREVALVFLRLGCTAFGGPAAHVALLEQECVRRRRWVTREEFLDLLGAANLIPGPNSTELALFLGHRRAGWPGLVAAGLGFILPATLIVGTLAWAYVRYGRLPSAAGLLYGIKPVLIAVVAQALWSLGRSAVKTRTLAVVGTLAVALTLSGVHELLVLFGLGLALAARRRLEDPPAGARLQVGGLGWLAAVGWPGTTAGLTLGASAAPFSLSALFLFFLKVGAVLYGSGYVLLAFLRADLVERWGWLTESQLLDAVAVGQFTPGPLFTTATFIGYMLGGGAGAALATLGIFLPSFAFVAAGGRLIPRLRASPVAGAFLDGVNVASLALMAVVAVQLAHAAVVDGFSLALALGAGVVLWRLRCNAAWLVLGGGALGWLVAR